MREIKFRAWDKKQKCWLYFSLNALVTGAASKHHHLTNWCQYTGLKDKNGTEIWEGDILKESYRIERIDGSMNDNINTTIGEVVFKVHEDDGYEGYYAYGWFIGGHALTPKVILGSYNNSWWKVKDGDSFGFEVIGDIYQNPELLTNK